MRDNIFIFIPSQGYNSPMKKNYSFTLILVALLLIALAACTPQTPPAVATLAPSATSIPPTVTSQPATPTTTPTLPASTQAAAQSGSYSDPFAYCAAVGTVDTPDVRYTGPRMPDAVAQGLKKASGASADAPIEMFTTGAYWRCMDGKVYACTVGANLPCDSKANTDKTPTQPEFDFCRGQPHFGCHPGRRNRPRHDLRLELQGGQAGSRQAGLSGGQAGLYRRDLVCHTGAGEIEESSVFSRQSSVKRAVRDQAVEVCL